MRKLPALAAALLMTTTVQAQVPQGM